MRAAALLLVVALAAAGCGGHAATTTTSASRRAQDFVPGEQQRELRGAQLYVSAGCSGCHTVDGTHAVGPTFDGLAGGHVRLADGRRVTATPSYLARAIRHPAADRVAGYPATPVVTRRLSGADVADLVEFLQMIGPP